ncbi:Gfo/Idh/MocA family oxidoreductase [Nocardiopsis sp. ARC36]
MNAPAPLRTVVCGTNFGRLYIDAVRSHPGFTLAGLLSTGSRHSRELAERHGVPCHTSPDELPADIDAAVVAVPAAVMGGQGSELARTLLAKGVHVLQEHPLHPDELSESLRAARKAGRQFQVNTHYPHVAPVREFIEAARRLRRLQRVLFVDAAAPVHVLAPLIDILARALGGTRPWRLGDPVPPTEDVVAAAKGGAAEPAARGHRRSPADTAGAQPDPPRGPGQPLPLLAPRGRGDRRRGPDPGRHPRARAVAPADPLPRDSGHRLVFTPGTGAESLRLPASAVLGQAGPPPRISEIFSELWPEAIGEALDGFAAAVAEGGDPLRSAQQDLAVFALWRELMERLGPPELIRPPPRAPGAGCARGAGRSRGVGARRARVRGGRAAGPGPSR